MAGTSSGSYSSTGLQLDRALRPLRIGRAARLAMLLPLAAALPLLLNWLGRRLSGGPEQAALLTALLCGVALAGGVAWAALLLKRTELRAAQDAGSLRDSEAYLRSMFDAPLFAIAAWNAEGKLTDANRTFLDLLGFSQQDIVAGKLSWNSLSPDEETPLREQMSVIMFEHGRVGPFERELIRADGSRVPVLFGSVQLKDGPEGVSFVLDISELQHARRELQERNRELELSNSELDSFSYSVSHDLRAPLRAIEGFSKALEEDYAPQLDEEAQHYIGRVRAATLRMAHLIDDLLHLSKVTRAELRLGQVDVSALAELALGQLREADPERRVDVGVQPGMTACADGRLLRIVLENLLSNAWKFSAGRDPAWIRVGAENTEKGTAYFVEDNGAGFDMEYAPKLFSAFQRLHRADQFDGTGIGLAIVRRIVARHGGEVWATAEPDRGARFCFTIPQQEET